MTEPAIDPQEVADMLQDVRIALAGLRGFGSHTNGVNTVTIDAGKGPAWIAASCAVAMLVGLLVACAWLSTALSEQSIARAEHAEAERQARQDQSRRIDALDRKTADLDAYLSAIYMQAPQLKPKEKTP